MKKLCLLVWKNSLLRIRYCSITACEIILPLLCAALILALNALIKGDSGNKEYAKLQEEAKHAVIPANEFNSYVLPEIELIHHFQARFNNCDTAWKDKCFMAYAPNDARTNWTIGELKKRVGMPVEANPEPTDQQNETAKAKREANLEEADLKDTATGEAAERQTTEDIVNVKWMAFETGSALEKYVKEMFFKPDDERLRFLGGIVFTGPLSYTIRLNDTSLPDTKRQFVQVEPSSFIDYLASSMGGYRDSGFAGLQVAIDKLLIQNQTSTNAESLPKVKYTPMPYPEHKVTLNAEFDSLYINLIIFGFIFVVPSVIRSVINEKETGIRELLKLFGVPGWLQWLAWMINSMILMGITVLLMVAIFFGAKFIVYGDFVLWFLILYLFTLANACFCFFITSFFQGGSLPTTAGIVLYLATYSYITGLFELGEKPQLPQQFAAGLIPSVSLFFGLKLMIKMESEAIGATWSTLARPMSDQDPLCLLHVIVMYLISIVMYMLLTMYLECVLPSEFGVRKPFYFLCQPSFWCGKTEEFFTKSEETTDEDKPGFEPYTSDAPVGIEIKNLRKKFGWNKVAVDGLSAKMYHGEIFALLGHNGAGKTTTISMLSGMFKPTSGSATINGYDITTNLDKCRKTFGLCPQHNMLFDKLTVLEHLRFFGALKGLSSAEAKKEAAELVDQLVLTQKKNNLSEDLSGGQKRKLNMGMALIGGSKVVILDEPTSGMDPESRRAIWDLLLEVRTNKTIVLTTHFMDEADVLGDRIGIMAGGKLQCCGTPLFLKRYYGGGDTLKLTFESPGKRDGILSFVRRHVPDASLKKASNNAEMLITLPNENTNNTTLAQLMTELTSKKKEFDILTLGLSATSMDEVFLKVGEITEHPAAADKAKSSATVKKSKKPEKSAATVQEGEQEEQEGSVSLEQQKSAVEAQKVEYRKVEGSSLTCTQFTALMKKKLLHSFRRGLVLFSQILVPFILTMTAVSRLDRHFEQQKDYPALRMHVGMYDHDIISAYSVVSATDPALGKAWADVVGATAKNTGSKTAAKYILDEGKDKLVTYRKKYIVGADIDDENNIRALFNIAPYHSAPLSMNLAMNAILESKLPNQGLRIEVTNHPLRDPLEAAKTAFGSGLNAQFSLLQVKVSFTILFSLGLALFGASFVSFPTEERICKAKQLQLMTGVNPILYWFSAFAWDFITVLPIIALLTACFYFFGGEHGTLTQYGGLAAPFIILSVYAYAVIWLSYLMSLFTGSPGGAFGIAVLLHIASGMIMAVLLFPVELLESIKNQLGNQNETNETNPAEMQMKAMLWGSRILPAFSASNAAARYLEIAKRNAACRLLSDETLEFLCDPNSQHINPEHRGCCEKCAETHGWECFKPVPYLTWSYYQDWDKETKQHGFPGILQQLFYVFLNGVIFQCLLFLFEFGVIASIRARLSKKGLNAFQGNVTDDDVLGEAQRVSSLVAEGRVSEEALLVSEFCKNYGVFQAVIRLSFGVHHGECFGLLGVNGAGKTTTFRMLTGDEIRSCGNAYAFMTDLKSNKKKFMSNIGYCPQYDAILNLMTGRQMVYLFAKLRGIPADRRKAEVEKWLEMVGLTEAANVQCGKYSGGMKRRLCVAMAAVGDPPLLLMDEPTSGVDPVSRRQFWKVVELLKSTGQAVILTSHTMDECEALCSRLGIMVNGQMQCIGPIPHLKDKFAQGYSLTIRLKANVPPDSAELHTLGETILQKFDPCTLKDIHRTILKYQIHNTSISWGAMFNTMESLKKTYDSIIEDYAVSEASLEEVFLSFAKRQYGDFRTHDMSLIKRIASCKYC